MTVRVVPPDVEAVLLGEKGAGLAELAQIDLRVPDTIIFAEPFVARYASLDSKQRRAAIKELIDVFVRFHQTLEARLPLVALRCGLKHRAGGVRTLPDSLLNLGLGSLSGSSVAPWPTLLPHVESACTAHAFAFFSFFERDTPDAFATRPLHEQLGAALPLLLERISMMPLEDVGARTLIVQRMVFGNWDDRSLSGMCYTRHPHTGEPMDYGCFIVGRQGMALGGVDSPEQRDLAEMAIVNPVAYHYLRAACARIEHHYRDVHALEYTSEGDTLYLLQNTVGRRTYVWGSRDA